MATTLSETAGNAACNAVVDLLDGGTLVVATSGDVEVATITFGTPAYGAAASGVATAEATTEDSDATGGTAALAIFKTSGAAELMRCTVSGSGGAGDILLNTVSADIPAAAVVNVTSLTHTVTVG
jgi:hypothetical protein